MNDAASNSARKLAHDQYAEQEEQRNDRERYHRVEHGKQRQSGAARVFKDTECDVAERFERRIHA